MDTPRNFLSVKVDIPVESSGGPKTVLPTLMIIGDKMDSLFVRVLVALALALAASAPFRARRGR